MWFIRETNGKWYVCRVPMIVDGPFAREEAERLRDERNERERLRNTARASMNPFYNVN